VIPRGLLPAPLVACEASAPPDRTVKQPGVHAVGTRRIDIGWTLQIQAAFFRATIDDDPGARGYLDRGFPDGITSVEDLD